MKSIRVLLAEDNFAYQQVIEDVLSEVEDVCLLGSAPDPESFKDLLQAETPDIALLDINLVEEGDGIELLKLLQTSYPDVKCIMVTVEEETVKNCYELGAKGYLLKNKIHDFCGTIRRVMAGELVIPSNVGELLVKQVTQESARSQKKLELKNFSEREIEILHFLKSGKKHPEIADQLCISTYTIKRHIENIRAKSGASIKFILERYDELL